MRVLQPDVMLDNETRVKVLTQLKIKHNLHSMNPYFYISLTVNTLDYNRKPFKPEETNTWRHTRKATPINSHKPLIIPIHCKYNSTLKNNHYIMVARFKSESTQAS